MSGAPAAAGESVFWARGVGKRFSRSGRWVLAGVDFAAWAGTVSVIAGGNGSGKSTLLRIVANASRPTRGSVQRVAGPVGYVPERLPAQLRMTAQEYVTHLGRVRGLERSVVLDRSRALFDRLELTPGPGVPVGELSKGNRQKVALTQAFLVPPRLLVLDEPFSGLDEQSGLELVGLVGEARWAGTAVVLSAHQATVLPAADAVHLLSGGALRPLTAVAPEPAGGWTAGQPRAARRRLVLRAVTPTLSPDDLAGTSGVLATDYDPDRGLLTVLTADADRLLVLALSAGWSFHSGQPAGG